MQQTNDATNPDHAQTAADTIADFCKSTGLSPDDEADTAITDILANLQHLCTKLNFDFEQLLQRARSHYRAEAIQHSEAIDPWAEDPEYPVADWQYEVANDDTRNGYIQWVQASRERDQNEAATSEVHTKAGSCA